MSLFRSAATPSRPSPVVIVSGERVTPHGQPSYGAFRDGTHDDLVMAVALAAWYCRYNWPDPNHPVHAPPF